MSASFKVLGINYGGHDTSAVLMVDGEPVACCEEERYNKKKHTRDFPTNAIRDALQKGGIKDVNELDEISFTYNPSVLNSARGISKMRRTLPNRIEFKSLVKDELGYEGNVRFNLHHMCHVASAYYPSGFDEALLISNDGIGEIDCSLIATGRGGKIDILHPGNRWPNSIGLFYTAITAYLGWKPHYDEGIVMGLAPYGDDTEIIPGSNRTYREIFEEIIFEIGDYEYEVNPYWVVFHRLRDKWVSDKFIEMFGPRRKWEDPITDIHKNIASAAQRRLETITMRQLRKAQKETGLTKLCIAGGVGLNCSLNGKIERSGLFDEIFVQPASGDNGTPLGACYLSTRANNKAFKPRKWHNFYLGSSFSDAQIEAVLKERGYTYENANFNKVVDHIESGKIVGWFQGGAEFGPRALGNRSILCAPHPASMKDHINAKVKFREEFRPFAPMVLDEDSHKYFELSQQSPHMLIATKVVSRRIRNVPAITHVDDSARVQTVTRELNPRIYDLLSCYKERSGCSVLLNTSFNVKGQPIVNDPEDALGCYESTEIDVLVIGNFILTKENE